MKNTTHTFIAAFAKNYVRILQIPCNKIPVLTPLYIPLSLSALLIGLPLFTSKPPVPDFFVGSSRFDATL